MTDVPIPADRIVDVDGRDPERTPMQWDDTVNAGFSSGAPWLPVAPDAPQVNVALQQDDPASLLALYRRLLRVRGGSPALRHGAYRTLAARRGVYAYAREAEGEQLLVAINFSGSEQRVALGGGPADVVLSTDHTRAGTVDGAGVALAPDEGVVLRAH